MAGMSKTSSVNELFGLSIALNDRRRQTTTVKTKILLPAALGIIFNAVIGGAIFAFWNLEKLGIGLVVLSVVLLAGVFFVTIRSATRKMEKKEEYNSYLEDFLTLVELTSKSNATDEDIKNLSDEVNRNFWEENKERLLNESGR